MKRTVLVMSLLCLSVTFFMQCSNDALFTDNSTFDLKAGKGPGGGGPGGGGGEEPETAGNNLSFPVILADGFNITPIGDATFEVPYVGEYDGLTVEQIAYLESSGPWYPQKTEGNVWQADFDMAGAEIIVDYVDWGDVIEAVHPTLGRPFRLEVTLYTSAEKGSGGNLTMARYPMEVLENPSSPTELQGTNSLPYQFGYATIVSPIAGMTIQKLGNEVPSGLLWDANGFWYLSDGLEPPGITVPEIIPFSFAPELNVGGKYIYGASEGGWRPTATGWYRLTFHMTGNTAISLLDAAVMNFDGNTFVEPETTASSPQVDAGNNITYVDVEVVAKGGGGSHR